MNRILAALAAALLVTAGCTRTVRVNTTGPLPVVETAPVFVGAGERVRVVVVDSVWGHQYVTLANLAELTTIHRGLVFGDQELSTLSKWFAPATRNLEPSDFTGNTVAGRAAIFALRAPPVRRTAADRELHAALLATLDTLNAVSHSVHELATEANAEFGTLDENPELGQALDVLFDPTLSKLAEALVRDPTTDEAQGHLARLALNPDARLERESLDSLVMRARQFRQRLDALNARVPDNVTEAAVEDITTTLVRVHELRTQRLDAVRERDRLSRDAEGLARRLGTTLRQAAPLPDEPLDSVAAGRNLNPLFDSGGVAKLGDVHRMLRTLSGNTRRLAAALNRLPEWTRGPGEAVVLEQAFAGPKELTLKVLRTSRYGTFSAAPASPPSGGGGNDGQGEGNAGGEREPAGTGTLLRVSSLREEHRDTVATIRVEVLPRYSFHLGAGLVRSPLETRTFIVTADTVDGGTGQRLRQTGRTPSQLFPAALLGYTLLPFGGKTYDARAYNRWPSLEALGVSVQVGVSLRDPAENVFLGGATEPFPGLHVGFGYHMGYVETSRYSSGDFVPDAAGPATEKHWEGEWGAWSVGVDAAVFFKTVGGLFK